jgi:pantothenate kinase
MKLEPTKSQAEIFRKIFVYHNIDENEIALQLWTDDLFKYNAEIITQAWNEWRMNEKTKPKSYDIAKISKRLKYIEDSKEIGKYVHSAKKDDFVRGRSIIEDEIMRRKELSIKNNPHLIQQLRETQGIYGKISLCALAQNISMSKINSILAPLFKRWKENEQKEAQKVEAVKKTDEITAQNHIKQNPSRVQEILKDTHSDLSWLLSE